MKFVVKSLFLFQLGPNFKPDDPSAHKKHGGFMHDLGKAATEAYLGGSRKIWQNVPDFQIFDSKIAQINSKFVIVNEILFKIHFKKFIFFFGAQLFFGFDLGAKKPHAYVRSHRQRHSTVEI